MFAVWIYIAILAGLFSNLFNFLSRHFLKDHDDPTAFAWFFEAFRLLLFICIAPFGFQLVLSFQSIAALLFLGVTEFVSVYFFMKMHAYSHLSISTIISRTRLIWVPILAFFIFHEVLNIWQYFGIFVIFMGLTVTTTPGKITLDKGMKYAYITSFLTALVAIAVKIASPYASTPVLILFMSAPSVILFPLFMKSSIMRIKKSVSRNMKKKIIIGITNALAMYYYAVALKIGPTGAVTAIYQGMMVFSIFGGIFILHETHDLWKKMLSTIVILIGLYLLTIS